LLSGFDVFVRAQKMNNRGEEKSPAGLILLAAGESSRLRLPRTESIPKQLLKFRGKTLLRRAAENALASGCEKTCVVLGANFEILREEISDLEIEIAVNENWRRGMSSSLKTGLEKLLTIEPKLSSAAVTLADQPLVDAVIIRRLIQTFQVTDKKIVAAEYAGTVGVPAVFARSLFEEILNLSAESGAKRIIKKYAGSVEKITVPEAAFDIDTIEEYENLLRLERD
jgi:molybdenum cofactor cytidylyltransferase